MNIKGFFSRFFSRGPDPEKDTPTEALTPPGEQVSPFADLKPEEPDASLASDRQAKDVFLLNRISSGPRDTVGLYYPKLGTILIRDPYEAKAGRLLRCSTGADFQPLWGDWDGDGIESFGLFDSENARFWIWGINTGEQPERNFMMGMAGQQWVGIVGDWQGSGKDGIGVYDPSTSFYWLQNEAEGGHTSTVVMFGATGKGWIPLAGDWNGDGKDGIGAFDPTNKLFFLRNTLSTGLHEILLRADAALPDSIPIVGDWNGDGADEVGLFNAKDQQFILYPDLGDPDRTETFDFGPRGVEGRPFSVRWML